jgi:hypothetical protein
MCSNTTTYICIGDDTALSFPQSRKSIQLAISVNGMVPPCSCPRQQTKLARGGTDEEHAMSQTPNTAMAVIGIDVGKNSFHVVGHDARGAIVLRQKWSRGSAARQYSALPDRHESLRRRTSPEPQLASLCHDATLMPAKYVRPYPTKPAIAMSAENLLHAPAARTCATNEKEAEFKKDFRKDAIADRVERRQNASHQRALARKAASKNSR